MEPSPLANGGALMTNGYSTAPQCRPSRVGLMAGRIQNENHADSGEGEGAMPRTVNLVSGPSRTGDIEQTIIMGAHGPRQVCIIVVKGH